ncbi:hypothetical protein CRG98_002673 [Punica granatum]|uniref:G-patch domain-containing protein n=1 Tax=Punica granatum TaxID=22663 RepID=A0A2I0L9S7_PUNGR|nr:hypothetical protein CRG98_002673 [Punica granatum]
MELRTSDTTSATTTEKCSNTGITSTFQKSLSRPALNWFMSLREEDIPSWAELSKKFVEQYQYNMKTLLSFLELSTMEMVEWRRGKSLRITPRFGFRKQRNTSPPNCEAQQIQMFQGTLKGAYYSHLMGHKSTFSEMIMARKQVDLGIKLGRLEGSTKKGERESSRKISIAAAPTNGRRASGISTVFGELHTCTTCHFHIRSANRALSASTPRSVGLLFGPTGPTSISPIANCSSLHSRFSSNSTIQTPGFESSSVDNRIRSIAPNPDFDPTIQDQSRRCEYHQGVPSHTTDNCWKLRERIQHMIDDKQLTFNAVRPPNVQANPLPDHGSSSGPSINMINVCAIGEYETEQEASTPFIIEYVPSETVVGYVGLNATPAPFVIEVPAHSQALHIVCKCNNFVIGQVMINNGLALNVCPVSTLKQMNVDLNRIRLSKTAVRAFDGSRREVNGGIDLLIDVGPCSFSVTFQVLDIPNAFSLLLGRPWIHSAGTVSSSLHQRIKFIAEGRLITVKGEEDYAIYKETAVPYISIRDDENLHFHSFEIVSVVRDYGEVGFSHADRMIGKVLLRHNHIPGSGLEAHGQGINHPIEVEEYKNGRGLDFRSSCHEIIEARRGKHLHHLVAHYGRINRGIPVPPLSYFFPSPPHIVEGALDNPSLDSDDALVNLPAICAVAEETPPRVYKELNNWTSVPRYSAVIADVLHLNPNLRHIDSSSFEEHLEESQPIYFGEGLDEDGRVPEIEESLCHLEDRQLSSVKPTEEINVGTEEPRTLKIGTGLNPTQRAE